MKTAVSLPDPLFARAEKAAKRLGISRSEFYGRAITVLVDSMEKRGITERLNQIYGDEPERMDPGIAAMQTRTIDANEGW